MQFLEYLKNKITNHKIEWSTFHAYRSDFLISQRRIRQIDHHHELKQKKSSKSGQKITFSILKKLLKILGQKIAQISKNLSYKFAKLLKIFAQKIAKTLSQGFSKENFAKNRFHRTQ